ncbi:hypothetical protein HY374_00685 [Candidatus Berkelbacteria bacterium]|nr:hypothetical protein [Candidatus Berkelbacteria bacterium]
MKIDRYASIMSLEAPSFRPDDNEVNRVSENFEQLRARIDQRWQGLVGHLDAFQALLPETPEDDQYDLREMALEDVWQGVYAIEQELADFDPSSGLAEMEDGEEIGIQDSIDQEEQDQDLDESIPYHFAQDPLPVVQERKKYWNLEIIEAEQRRFEALRQVLQAVFQARPNVSYDLLEAAMSDVKRSGAKLRLLLQEGLNLLEAVPSPSPNRRKLAEHVARMLSEYEDLFEALEKTNFFVPRVAELHAYEHAVYADYILALKGKSEFTAPEALESIAHWRRDAVPGEFQESADEEDE